MLTIVTVDHDTQTIYARELDADAASGELVLLGHPTDQEIRDEADEQLCAPDLIPDYQGYKIEWIG